MAKKNAVVPGGVPAAAVARNASAEVNPATTRPKGGAGAGGMIEAATAVNTPNVQERLGFKGAPQMPLYVPNAAEAGATYRNVRIVQSAVGNRDFYLRRQYGQNS